MASNKQSGIGSLTTLILVLFVSSAPQAVLAVRDHELIDQHAGRCQCDRPLTVPYASAAQCERMPAVGADAANSPLGA